MYFYCYKIQFLDGSYYFGSRQSVVEPSQDTYWGSPVTHKAKWEQEMFQKTILSEHANRDEALEEEKLLIGDLWKTDDKCLNAMHPSNLGWHDEVAERKRRANISKVLP